MNVSQLDVYIQDLESELSALTRKLREARSQRALLTLQADKKVTSSSITPQSLTGEYSWTLGLYEAARKIFGISSFRKHQLEVVNSIMLGYDVLLVMPTGGGKSLCFQLPATIFEYGLTVVVSPLISLMFDQVTILNNKGVYALMMSSSCSKEELQEAKQQLIKLQQTHNIQDRKSTKSLETSDHLRVLYVTPERIAKGKQTMSLLEKVYEARNLKLLVVDEVHCISQWGHSFRQDYQKLSLLKKHFPKTPLLALTATATSEVVADVKIVLGFESCLEFRAHINRPNLFFMVLHKPKSSELVLDMLETFIKTFTKSSTGIIYCLTRKEAGIICDALGDRGFGCLLYHGDMDTRSRHIVQNKWSNGEVQIVVATVAFGMGIHKTDVRFVIHYTMPKSPENYYQECGRAGRDGSPACCLLLYRASDVPRHSVMVYWEPSGLSLLYKMVEYCHATSCRRNFLCTHFGDSPVPCEKMCDICCKETWKDNFRSVDGSQESEPKNIHELNPKVTPLKRLKVDRKAPSCNSSSASSVQLLEAIKIILDILKCAEDEEGKKSTLLQLQVMWKRQLSAKHISGAKLDNPDDLQSILINLLLLRFIKEIFYHTPYSTTSYLKLSLKGHQLLESLSDDSKKFQSNLLGELDTLLRGTPEHLNIPCDQNPYILRIKSGSPIPAYSHLNSFSVDQACIDESKGSCEVREYTEDAREIIELS